MSTTTLRFAAALHPLALSVFLLSGQGGCGWHVGPVTSTSTTQGWGVGSVSGATVEPGLQAAARGELGRALAQRGAQGTGPAIDLTLHPIQHSPAQASSQGQVGWRTEVAVELKTGNCAASAQAEQRWSAPGAGDVVAERREAVDGALSVAIGLALDRLLSQEECS